MPRHVWYASYGSNLSRHRFERYLHGGTPVGGRRWYRGASDRTPPHADRPFDLPFRLRFGGASRTWGGGMAFVDMAAPGRTFARIYRISAQQFADVHAQENGGDAHPADLGGLTPGQWVHAAWGNYPIVVCCGVIERMPVLTFTTERIPDPAPPASSYLRTIAAGLAEAHRLAPRRIVRYLRSARAVRAAYTASELSAVVRAGVASAMVPPPRHS